jgi:hypothetical protein
VFNSQPRHAAPLPYRVLAHLEVQCQQIPHVPSRERDIDWVIVTGAGASWELGVNGVKMPLMGDWSGALVKKLNTTMRQHRHIRTSGSGGPGPVPGHVPHMAIGQARVPLAGCGRRRMP